MPITLPRRSRVSRDLFSFQSGELDTSSGTATRFDPNEPGEFLVVMESESSHAAEFWTALAHVFGGNYRIMNLGPIDHEDGKYDWAGDRFLFIFTRGSGVDTWKRFSLYSCS